MRRTTIHIALLTPLALAAAGLAHATNGMNMEGYGPISTGMGGASQAFDHGTAAMAQNPATLGLMAPGSRIDAALGVLGPDVTSKFSGMPNADSGGTSYVMPAFGYARRNGPWTYGVGVFAQGGMGTEYGANTFLAMGSGNPVRSELGVGRLLVPLTFQVSPALTVGASLDFVWATLDMRMAASGAQLAGLVTGASGNLAGALQPLSGAPWARIDFSDSSDFSGAAKGTGWAGKIGLVYKASPDLSLGASYQFETSLSDLKTGDRGATLSAFGGMADPGKLTVVDFQWPATWGFGLAWQATPQWLVAADVKRIEWSGVMKDFKMRYDSAGMGGSVSFSLPQNWKNQTVTNLGVSYAMNSALTLRGGVNVASNPIPAAYVHPLFPATVEKHYTLGMGYRFSPVSEFNASLTIAPESTVTNGQGVVIDHSQQNVQLMYTHRF